MAQIIWKEHKMYPYVKRILDLLLSFLALIMLLPIFIIIAITIRIESPGSVIFKQDRLGKDGNIFVIYKFRTMVDNAVQLGTGLYTYEDDPRITKVGRVLRKTSMDELPQIVNILKGDMSIIGPRPPYPLKPRKYEEYDEVQKRRFSVLPGMTGLAQVKFRSAARWDERIKLDVYYVDHLSFWLDVQIFFQTIKCVIFPKNVYVPEEEAKSKIMNQPTEKQGAKLDQ